MRDDVREVLARRLEEENASQKRITMRFFNRRRKVALWQRWRRQSGVATKRMRSIIFMLLQRHTLVRTCILRELAPAAIRTRVKTVRSHRR